MKQIDHDPNERTHNTRLYAVAFIIMGLMMGGLHWLLTGIDDNFGMGVAVGLFIGIGLIFTVSRQAREL